MGPIVQQALREMGFEQLTSIKAKTIPRILANTQDLICIVRTVIKKISAFGILMLNNLYLKSDHFQS